MFRRPIVRYGKTPEPETPYQRAGQVWDDRIGSARVQAKNWRFAFFGALALSGGLAVGLVWQSARGTITPWVVEVDKLGQAQAVSPATADYQPTDPQIAWHLARFIADVRSVSLDPVLMRQNWLAAYDFATRRGARFLDAYARGADPFAHVGETTVSVQVTSVVRASEQSFEVKWTETAFERGTPAGMSHWTAVVTTVTVAPTSADALRKNPLGIYVDAIDWSRELEPPAPVAPATAVVPAPVPTSAPMVIPTTEAATSLPTLPENQP